MDKTELITQTKLAFDFIQKLYYEVSYLFKEIEGLLSEEDEEFLFGRASGYAVTARSSNGLESAYVKLWMYKKIAVFFIPKSSTKLEGGQTITRIIDNPKIIYIRVVLEDKDIKEPLIYFGILKDFIKKGEKGPVKIEQLMANIDYYEAKVFKNDGSVDYEDANASFKGKLSHVGLYDINNSEDIVKKILTPLLKQFRET
jgi:hypothetical protein